jgi:DNA-binding SARP family transcriptional activator/tetratricopeptide (TPR) repeat protein
MRVEVDLLGGFAMRVGGRAVLAEHWRRSAAALVKLLALAPRHVLHREQVMDALWPGLEVDQAAPRLHKAAHYARRTLGDPRGLVLGSEGVSLFPDASVDVDVERFQVCAQRALAIAEGTGEAPAQAAAALELWTGDLLPEDPYEPWLEGPREHLNQLRVDLLRRARRWEELAALDPGDEEASVECARELADAGDRRSALRQLERLERALRRELGMTPSNAVAALRTELVTAEPPNRAGSLGPASPLVGRHHELDQIDRLLAELSRGEGRTVFISGPPGIGKTALLGWLDRRARERGLRVGVGAAAALEGAWPFAPVLEALADLCRHSPGLLDGLADDYRNEIEVALRGASPPWTGESRHQRLFVSAAELLRLAASGRGAVLVVDDAHDADDASLRLLHYLSRTVTGERILIVIAHRPWPLGPAMEEIRRSLIGRGTSVPIGLGPLADPEIRQLTRRVIGNDQEPLDWVVKLSGGNPFAALELARTIRDDSSGPAGALVLRGLSSEAISALTSVAVLGVEFSTDEYAALSDIGAQSYVLLEEALTVGAVERTGSGYRFRHSLVRDALLDGAAPHQLVRLRRKAAEVLQQLRGSPARIGHHLLQAGDVSAAAPFLLQAARADAAVGAYRDALSLIEAICHDVTGEERGSLLSLRADMLLATGDAGAILAYREALAATDDPREQRRLRPRLARAATFAGDYASAGEALDGLEPDGSEDDSALLLQRGILAYLTGDMPTAEAAADEARRRLGVADPGDWRMYDLVTLQGLLAHLRGEWFARLEVELRAGAERPDLALSLFDSHLCVAEFLLYGPTPYDEVLALASTLRQSAQRSGVLRAVAFATAVRGEAALLSGDLPLAASELVEAVALHHEVGSTAGEAHSLQRLAEVRLAQGDRAEALRLLHRALPLARWSAIALHLLQRVYGTMIRAAPDVESARAVVDQAIAALGQEDNCTFCSIMLDAPAAVACADAGDLQDARRHLERAERSAVLWRGTAWPAAIAEATAHLHRAEGDAGAAGRLLREAAELFAAAGQPLDADRCLA